MIKKKTISKMQLFVTIFTCTLLLSCTLMTKIAYANEFLGCYIDRNFYGQSQAELIEIYPRSTYFTLHVEDNVVDDELMVHIVNLDNAISSYELPLYGALTLYEFVLPPGEYRIWFTGNSNILKTEVGIYFYTDED